MDWKLERRNGSFCLTGFVFKLGEIIVGLNADGNALVEGE